MKLYKLMSENDKDDNIWVIKALMIILCINTNRILEKKFRVKFFLLFMVCDDFSILVEY